MRFTPAILLIALLHPWGLAAQPSGATFEVTSVRRSALGAQGRVDTTPGRFTATAVTLRELVKLAYPDGNRLRNDNQIAGGPAWIDADRFDVEATGGPTQSNIRPAPGAVAPPEGAAVETLRAMLRSLLRDRFALVAHSETQDLPIFALERVDPNRLGPQLRRLDADCTNEPRAAPERGAAACGGFTFNAPGQIAAHGVTIPMLISLLTNLPDVGRIIHDRTGLSGVFDLELAWNRTGTPDSNRPSIFTAVQEQLGLRLEPARGAVDVLVIDRVEPPNPN